MALPISGPLSGSQIWAEIAGTPPNNLSLSGMYASSSLSSVTPLEYSGFYGYAQSTLTQFFSSTITSKFAVDVCNAFSPNILYHNGAFDTPGNGDIVYTDAAGTTLANWVGYKGFSSTPDQTTFAAGRIGVTDGVINSATLCI